MASDLNWYLEAEKRGLLQPDEKAWLEEARRRGIVSGDANASAGQPAAPKAPPQGDASNVSPENTSSTAGDLAKSAGIGVAQGLIGLGTLGGNLEKLGRIGINRGASLFGAKEPVVDEKYTYLINYDDLKGALESKLGKFYKPQTTGGEYLRTLGEFAGGGGPLGRGLTMGQRFLNTAVPAVTSETAGQLTKGTEWEPWARVAGGVAGSFAPGVGARAYTPSPADPLRARQVQVLENEGVTALTAGQRTGNRIVRGLEDAANLVPMGGRRADQSARRAAEQFTQAALRRIGINSNTADPDTLNAAYRALGAEYDNVRVGAAVRADAPFVRRLERAVQDYRNITPQADRVPIIDEYLNEMRAMAQRSNLPGASGTMMTGRQFAEWHSKMRAAQRGLKGDPAAQEALGNMITSMDAQMARSLPRGQRSQALQDFRDLNRRYRNFLALEDAVGSGSGEWAALGLISPPNLKGAVKRQNKRDYTLGRGELSRLARAGEAVLKPLPSSGTAERSFFLKALESPAGMLPLAGAGMLAGGPAGVMLAATPHLLTAGAARGVTNNWVQQWLANQRYAQRPENLSFQAPLAFAPLELSRGGTPLTGSQQGLTADQLEEESKGAFQ